jgi:hypothetical protein
MLSSPTATLSPVLQALNATVIGETDPQTVVMRSIAVEGYVSAPINSRI